MDLAVNDGPAGPSPRLGSPEDDALAATVDRLVALVREQEAQIAALRALIETLL